MNEELKRFIENTKAIFGIDIRAETMEEARKQLLAKKDEIEKKNATRSGGLTKPATLNEASRSVECVISTETPVLRYDWFDGDYYEEILLAEGCQLENVKDGIPFINAHRSRGGFENVLGSTVNIRREGDEIVGTRIFSSVPEAERAFTMMKEGHLKRQSIGYEIHKVTKLKKGEKSKVFEKEIENTGELTRVYATSWLPVEDSIVIIPADPNAGVREGNQAMQQRSTNMGKDAENKAANTAQAVEEPKTQTIDECAVREQERFRLKEIDTLCREFEISEELRGKFIDGGNGFGEIENVRKAVLDEIAKRSKAQPVPEAGKIQIVKDGMDKVIPAMRDGLMMTHGVLDEKDAVSGAGEFRGMRANAFCAEFLTRRGEKVGFNITPEKLFERVMATTDFPELLSNTAERTVQKAFERAPETYQKFCDMSGSLSSLRAQKVARVLGTIDLLEVKEGEESEYAYLDEASTTVQLAKYARKIQFTEECLINDDLGEFMRGIDEFGFSVARLEGDMAFDWLISPPAIGNTAFFYSDHGNLAGSGSVINEANVGAGMTAMATQKDSDGKYITIRPTYFVVPFQLLPTAKKLMTSVGDATASQQVNTVYNAMEVIADARLDAHFGPLIAGGGKWPWFLLGPKGWTIKFFYLDGQKRYALTRWVDNDRDSITIKLKHRVACAAMSYQGFYKNAGN